MSLMLGTQKIAGLGLNGTSFPLLGHFWSDHIVNDISFLKADSFSWHSGEIYTAVYNHLVNDLTDATAQTDVINGISIEYQLAKDGHKIVLDDDSDVNHLHVKELYESFGASWYYILTTTNKAFKLPRTKYGFTGIDNNPVGTSIDNTASDTGIKSTQMYLYFFVGNYSRSAIEQTAGYAQELTELKANKSLDNLDEAGQAILDAKANVSLNNLDEVGQSVLDAKANVSNTVTTNTNQTITGAKTFTNTGLPIVVERNSNQQEIPSSNVYGHIIALRNKTYTKGDGCSSWLQGLRTTANVSYTSLYTRRYLDSDTSEKIAFVESVVRADGTCVGQANTPPVADNSTAIATTAYINTKFQVVSTAPANPDANVFYFIPE